MSADEKLKAAPATAGRTVGFVGGPEAGRARIIPESQGDKIRAAPGSDYWYRIWPFQLPGSKAILHLAFDIQKHPLNLLVALWEEYSVAAQIRGGDHGYLKRPK